jgi:N-acetylmuramoyl-L-alanine amidase
MNKTQEPCYCIPLSLDTSVISYENAGHSGRTGTGSFSVHPECFSFGVSEMKNVSKDRKNRTIQYITALLLCLNSLTTLSAPFTIMLDPAGDAQYTGRVIDDCFERGITLQLMEQLHTVIAQRFTNVRVVVTRQPGETHLPLQHANFANRLDVDLYISIHCYPESKPKSQLYLYYFSYNDPFASTPSPYALCPYDRAYLYSLQTTKKWGDMIARTLSGGQFTSLFIFHGNYALPFAPLIGIKKPAIAFEIGLKQKDSWKQFIEPIIASLTPI